MGASVAEYYGQRTDVQYAIVSTEIPPRGTPDDEIPKCPFSSSNKCAKLKSGYEPVCSVRNANGDLWINCPDRLCTTKKDIPLCDHQKTILFDIAQHIFGDEITMDQICVKREERIKVGEGNPLKADYIMTTITGRSNSSGPDRLIVEMQGGGETTQTGKLTAHIKEWRELSSPSNEYLREIVSESGPLVNNAWKRQQDQFLIKGNVAMKTWKGLGIAFCVGTLLFDYLMERIGNANIPDLKEYNWTLALIAIKEDETAEKKPGPIPLVVDESRILYTNYQTFVQALINQGEPTPEAFEGEFLTLSGDYAVVDF